MKYFCSSKQKQHRVVGLLICAIVITAVPIVAVTATPTIARTGSLTQDMEDGQQMRWPLDLEYRFMTSNFMEYREGRFHAGLDMKTQSKTGFAVRAVEDGYISRIRTATGGYGRVVYLLGKSGRTYVFAHLERFSDTLRELVVAAQQKRQTYAVNLHLAPGEVPVSKGDVLGLSGQSGTPGPHLHFEVRDTAQRPINPEESGFAVPDSFPPVISRIRVMPAALGAQVEGGLVACSIEDATGLATHLPPLTVRGPVAFSAKIVDTADIRGHKLEPYLITLLVDGHEVFVSRNTTFPFDLNSQARLEWLEIGPIRERWLFRRSPNRLPERLGEPWSLNNGYLVPGRHQISLIAADRSGNRAEVAWELVVLAPEQEYSVTRQVAWAEDPLGMEIPVFAEQDRNWSLTPFLLLSPDKQEAISALTHGPELPDGIVEFQLRAETGFPVLAPTCLLIIPAHLDDIPNKLYQQQGLVSMDIAAWYQAADWPIASAIEVPLLGAVSAQGWSSDVGVYRLSKKGTWEFVDYPQAPAASDSNWTFPLSKPGLHALFSDVGQPNLGEKRQTIELLPTEERISHGVTLPLWPKVEIPLIDTGSGINPLTLMVWLDGQHLIGEPDLPRNRLLIELPESLAAGTHVLGVEVADWAGRFTTRTIRLECRHEPKQKQRR